MQQTKHEEAFELCAALSRGLTVTGSHHDIEPSRATGYLFDVRSHEHGCPVVQSHDAYFAVTWFMRLERGHDFGRAHILRQMDPAQEAKAEKDAFQQRHPETFPMLDAWLSWRRMQSAMKDEPS